MASTREMHVGDSCIFGPGVLYLGLLATTFWILAARMPCLSHDARSAGILLYDPFISHKNMEIVSYPMSYLKQHAKSFHSAIVSYFRL